MRTHKFSGLLCIMICLALILGVTAISYARLPMNQFGTNWVKTHKFQIINGSGYDPVEWNNLLDLHTTGFQSDIQSKVLGAAEQGITKHSVIWAGKDGIDGNGIPVSRIQDFVAAVSTPDDSDGWYMTDEPPPSEFAAIAAVGNWLKKCRPNSLIYINTDITDPSIIDNMLSTIQPDILMGDFYPFTKGYGGGDEKSTYFGQIKMWRDKAVANGIPCVAWVQVFGSIAYPGYRQPSESEMRMNAWSYLTMGYKGLGWFYYDNSDASLTNWLVDNDTRQPRNSYYWSRSINSEIEKQGKYLRFLNNTDVRFVPNLLENSTPSGLTNWSAGAGGDNYIQAISLATPSYIKRDALIGFFTDASGQRYFMIQNLWRSPWASASELTSTITINYSGASLPVSGKVYRLDRSTGQSVEVPLSSSNNLTVTLPGGTGDLYSYQPFSLVGKDTVAPTRGRATINGGESTESTSVNLTLSANDDSAVYQMMISNSSDFNGATWETYATSKSWTLTSGDGMKTIYAKFKDEAGNISAVCSDTIQLQ